MSLIFEIGTVLHIKNKLLKYLLVFSVRGINNSNKEVIKIYDGNDKFVKNNIFLGRFTLELDKNQKNYYFNGIRG